MYSIILLTFQKQEETVRRIWLFHTIQVKISYSKYSAVKASKFTLDFYFGMKRDELHLSAAKRRLTLQGLLQNSRSLSCNGRLQILRSRALQRPAVDALINQRNGWNKWNWAFLV